MRALVVYESMYGNTHLVADAIGAGLGEIVSTDVVSVHDADPERVNSAVLLVVGGPTHAHGMSREGTRQAAADAIAKPDVELTLDPDAAGDGVREWLESLEHLSCSAAAFDTRVDMSPILSGRASKGIAKQLRHHGCELLTEPESFLVTKETHLEPDQASRAREWGRELGRQFVAAGRDADLRPT